MKYRIKDPDVVRGFKVLGWTYEFDEADVERFGFYWHGECRDRIYFDPCEEFEVEPVKELAEGWNPYPETKPEKDGSYFCAMYLNQQATVVMATYDKYSGFRDWDSDIFAWREMPKIWKE